MTDYFRGDQKAGITPPNLSNTCDFADHIVKARGKKSAFTSVSKEPSRIGDFGEVVYRVKRPELDSDGHVLVDHEQLVEALLGAARERPS